MPAPARRWNKDIDPNELKTASLSRFKEMDPNRLDCVIRALDEGMGVKAAARTFGMSIHTVYDVMHQHQPDAWKGKATRHLSKFVSLAAERLSEEVDDMDVHKLSIPMAIATDKLLLLSGQPTSITERRDTKCDINDLLAELPEAEVTEVETVSQKS